MIDIFDYTDYQKFLADLVYAPDVKRGFQAQLAKAMGCQAAYLSQVIKGKADLTEDHCFKLAKHLKLSEVETRYLMTLIRIARASSHEFKLYLETQRLLYQKESEDTKNRIEAQDVSLDPEQMQRYFSSWIPSLIHVATSSENFQTIESLSERLNLPTKKVIEVIQFLNDVGFVRKNKERWVYSGDSIHFSKASLSNATHQIQRRQQAIRSIELEDDENIHFSSVFTMDKQDFAQLKKQSLKYIESSHKTIHNSGSQELYGICLDVFKTAQGRGHAD